LTPDNAQPHLPAGNPPTPEQPSIVVLRRVMDLLLAAGIILRLAVLIFALPNNADPHQQVIEYIVEHGSLPNSDELNQSYHPPLYYLLMAPLWRAWHSSDVLHFASFVSSCVNLLLIRKLLGHPLVLPHRLTRVTALAFVCFMPEFVMFSGFVSNDTLTFLIGTIMFATLLRYLQSPSRASLVLLGITIGLGLLTKGTFLGTGPAVALVVLIVECRRGWRRAIPAVVGFCLLWTVLGCYKYLENTVLLGRPLAHNLDSHGITWQGQHGEWRGWSTAYDINVIKLIRQPILNPHNSFSIPLLMYATLWYPHIPSSSFGGNWHGYQWVGSILYAVAIIPTLILIVGVARGIGATLHLLGNPAKWSAAAPPALAVVASILMLLSNLFVVLAAGLKFDVWSCFQSRLCFQSMVPAIVLFGLGMEAMPESGWARGIIHATCWTTAACCVLYFVVEISLACEVLAYGPELKF